jgi:hypothetical protein
MQNKWTIGISIMALLLTLSQPVLAAKKSAKADKQAGVASIIVAKGQVSIIRAGKTMKAKKGNQLLEGDRIKVGALSRAALIMQDGSVIKLNEKTDLQMKVSATKKKRNRLKLLAGHLWAKIKRQGSNLEIETPSAVAAIKGTELVIIIDGKKVTLIVWDGMVDWFNDLGKKLVGAGNQSSAADGSAPTDPTKANLEDMDQWWDSVVDPANKTLKTTVLDKDGKEQKVNIKYEKK